MKKVFLLLTGLCFFLGSATVAMDEYINLPYISFENDATYNASSAGDYIYTTCSATTMMTAAECKSKLNAYLSNKGYDDFITISYLDDGGEGNNRYYIGIDITPNPTSDPRSFTIGSERGSIKVYQD